MNPKMSPRPPPSSTDAGDSPTSTAQASDAAAAGSPSHRPGCCAESGTATATATATATGQGKAHANADAMADAYSYAKATATATAAAGECADLDPEVVASDMYLRTDFLERVAHELRGPAGVALGALEEMERGMSPEQVEAAAPFLGMARRGIRRVLRTADNLHRTGQLAGKQVDWEMAPTDLQSLIEQAAKAAELLESRRGILVRVKASETPCVLPVDATWMSCAMGELVTNAIRHARHVASVETLVDPTSIRVIFSDDGRGFANLPVARFSPPLERRGLALSMPLVEDVVHAHSGEVQIQHPMDEHEHGGRVVLVFPRPDSAKE